MTLTQQPPEAESARDPIVAQDQDEAGGHGSWRGKPVVAAIAVVVVLAGTAWALLGSPWLRVQSVQVKGASEVVQRTIETAAAIELGRPMIRLDTRAAQQRVGALGEVESVRVVRVWPHTVVVEVQERMPVGVVPGPGGQTEVLGSDGRSMAVLETQPTDLPELRASSADLTVLVETISHLTPEIVATIQWASLANGRVELQLRDDAGVVVWGPPVDNWIKAEVLSVLLESEPDARWFDLSAARFPITALERPTRGATPSAAASPQPNGQPKDAASPTDGVPGGTLTEQLTTSEPTPLAQSGEQLAQLVTP